MATTTTVSPYTAKQVASAKFLGTDIGANVVGVGVATKIVEGVDTGIPCVRIYVCRKRESDKLASSSLIPEEFMGVPTDIVDIGRAFGPRINVRRGRVDRSGDVRPGDSIGPRVKNPSDQSNFNPVFSGTLSAVLRDKSSMTNFLLGNNHIMALNGRVPVDSDIVSPGAEDAGGQPQKLIGTLHSWVPLKHKKGANGANQVDCAIARVADGVRFDPRLPDGSLPVYLSAPDYSRNNVVKFGKSTGKTSGTIVDFFADVLVEYSFGTFRFVDQLLIDGGETDFAADGDSGALVVVPAGSPAQKGHAMMPMPQMSSDPSDWESSAKMQQEPTPGVRNNDAVAMGLVFAPAGRYTVACPISAVIGSLKNQLGIDLTFAG